jgi:hypothetical protein
MGWEGGGEEIGGAPAGGIDFTPRTQRGLSLSLFSPEEREEVSHHTDVRELLLQRYKTLFLSFLFFENLYFPLKTKTQKIVI